jgi:hypothetical protein
VKQRELAELLSVVGYLASHALLYGGRTDAPAYLWAAERTANPRPGDLVIEGSYIKWSPECIGRLVSVEGDDHSTLGPVYHITSLLTGKPVSWSNCHFSALPSTLSEAFHWGEDLPSAIAWHEEYALRTASPVGAR